MAEWMGLGWFLLVNWILLAIPIALFHQVLRGKSWAFRLANLYAVVMVLNGAGHLVGLLVTGRYVSGFAGAAAGSFLVVLGLGLVTALRENPGPCLPFGPPETGPSPVPRNLVRPHTEVEMFIYYFVEAPGGFEDVESALLDVLAGLPEAADVAYRRGEELRSRIGPEGSPVAKTVRLDVGRPHRGAGELRIPLTWEATGAPGLFPRMDADLVLAAVGPERAHLEFRGSYRPPLGPVGRVLDRALLHRLAESSVKGFVDRLAAALGERMAVPSPHGAAAAGSDGRG